MDTERFDQIATTFAQRQDRRGVLRVFGAALVGAGGLAFLGEHAADAKRKKRGKKGRKHNGKGGGGTDICLNAGDFCQTDSQCCPDKTKRICAVAFNASNSDTTCCGGEGATCGLPNEDGDLTDPFCCAGYDCLFNPGDTFGTCHKLPEED